MIKRLTTGEDFIGLIAIISALPSSSRSLFKDHDFSIDIYFVIIDRSSPLRTQSAYVQKRWVASVRREQACSPRRFQNWIAASFLDAAKGNMHPRIVEQALYGPVCAFEVPSRISPKPPARPVSASYGHCGLSTTHECILKVECVIV